MLASNPMPIAAQDGTHGSAETEKSARRDEPWLAAHGLDF
jgi:hypothetical protein